MNGKEFNEFTEQIKLLKQEKEVLKEALQYMAGMHGLSLSKCKLDNEIEYSCNQYVVNKETYNMLQKAINIIGWWE